MTEPPNVPGDRTVLDVTDLAVTYSTQTGYARAVDGVRFSVRSGRTLGVVGESGSGKSTIGKALLGLLPAGAWSEGSAVFDESIDLLSLTPSQRRRTRGDKVGIVFQEPMTRLDPLMRISGHFTETLRAHDHRIRKSEITRRSLEVLQKVGIPPTRWQQYPHEFSGGMRQRLMIALALVTRPDIIVADEPTTALDVLVEAQIVDLLGDIKRDFGTALVLITHNLGIVSSACDDVAVMYAGRIVEYGPTADVLRNPQHPYTRGLLASTVSLETTELYSIPGSPPSLLNLPPGCRFADRCPGVMDVCSTQQPPTIKLGKDGHRAECWLSSDHRDLKDTTDVAQRPERSKSASATK